MCKEKEGEYEIAIDTHKFNFADNARWFVGLKNFRSVFYGGISVHGIDESCLILKYSFWVPTHTHLTMRNIKYSVSVSDNVTCQLSGNQHEQMLVTFGHGSYFCLSKYFGICCAFEKDLLIF